MLDRHDQAHGLRQLFERPVVRVLPVMAGDDAQFTTFCGELAAALARLGHRPVLFDADRGRLAPALGLRPRRELMHVLTGECDIGDALCPDARGFALLAAARGLELLVNREDAAQTFAAFGQLRPAFDLVIVAAPPARLVRALGAAIEPLVLASVDPGSVQAVGDRLVALHAAHGLGCVRMVWRAGGAHLPSRAHRRLADVVAQAGGIELSDGGAFSSVRDAEAIDRIAALALGARLPEFSTGLPARGRAAPHAELAEATATVR